MDKFFFICMLLIWVAVIEAAPESALVAQLPGFNGTFPSKHYSGYVSIENVDADLPPKNLFYYFVQSEDNPSNDPVVLWLNGGPGCSSMDGFIYEHGPFNFAKGNKKGQLPTLHINPYSWSKVSNIIYLDSPAGVGFSYSKDREYETGDIQTAADTHKFLLQWFKQYPEFSSNSFYIAGESYAGIYIPTLAAQIHNGIKAGEIPVINFKGYAIGNGVTDPQFDGNALVPFAHGMSLISNDLYEEVKSACGGSYFLANVTCSAMLDKVFNAIGDLNIYDVLEPCYHSSDSIMNKNNSTIPTSFLDLGKTESPLPVRKRIFGRAWPFRAPVLPGIVPSWPELSRLYGSNVPCTDDEVATIWLNDQSVRNALHVASKNETGEWQLCSDSLSYNHDAGSMLSYHKNLTMQGYRALIYSGDHDMCVPHTGSEAWTRSLGYKIVEEWRAWYSDGQGVQDVRAASGYLQGYDHNLTYLTIKGAGHTVPEYKPKESLYFFSCWLAGQKIL